MRKDKEKAFEFRRQGLSYKKIQRELGIPISTLAGWFKNEPWSVEIRDRLSFTESLAYPEKLKRLIAVVKNKYAILHESYREEARKEFPALKNNPLFIAGLMLYWGEGDKNIKNSIVRLTNSEPEMIKIFCLFLKGVLGIHQDRIKARLILYPDLADEPQKRLWSKLIDLPIERFGKSTYIKGRHPKRRLSYGVCNVDVYSVKVKEKIFKWLELHRQYLINSV